MVNNWWSDNRRFILKLQHDNTVSYWAFCCCCRVYFIQRPPVIVKSTLYPTFRTTSPKRTLRKAYQHHCPILPVISCSTFKKSFPKCRNPDEIDVAPAAQRWSTLCFMPTFWSLNDLFGLTPQSKSPKDSSCTAQRGITLHSLPAPHKCQTLLQGSSQVRPIYTSNISWMLFSLLACFYWSPL